jgi:DnaJ-domain-containing protein 1
MARVVEVEQTRRDIRHTFSLWDIDPSEFEILWEEERDTSGRITRSPGVRVRYLRNQVWQEIACFGFPTRAENVRQCFLLLDRLRIAEQNGVQYQGLTYSKELTATSTESGRKQDLLDAYDILGVSPDDPIDLIKDVYRRKSMYYHPDKGGDAEKFKHLTQAYELILNSRGAK